MAEVGGKLNIQRSSGKVWVVLAAVVIVLLAATAGFFIWQNIDLRNHPEVLSQESTKRLLTKVSRLYALPGDEQPTVAQIQDKDKLKEQSFFKNAANDDFLLIYTKAKLALLYREKDDKLINVGPVSIDNKPAPAAQPAPATKKP